MNRTIRAILIASVAAALVGCGHGDANAQTGGNGGDAKPADLVKLSQFGHAGACAVAVGADGTVHALFTDAKEYGKPARLYHRASKDDGATWSEPKLVSDDESAQSAGPCRVLVDGSSRVYAIWKYIGVNELLEGPNGPALGVLAVRSMENGTWSQPRTFGDEHKPMTSWFAALDAQGKVNVVYSRADEAVDWKGRGMPAKNANNVDQLVFDGASEPTVTHLIVAKHVMTQAEQEASKAAGKYPAYEDTVPKDDGLWNLNGYIAADGRPRFLCEGNQPTSQTPQAIIRFDGQKTATFYEYKGYLGYNTFNWPPALLLGADGKEHVIRKPEQSENDVVRDYVVVDGSPGEKTDVITHDAPTAKIHGWWASPLAGGRMAAMAAVEPKVDALGPTDLYVAIGDGKGNWSKPMNVTDNAARAKFFAKAAVSQSTDYSPKFAAAASLKDGSVGVILLNAEHTISGLNTAGVTASGTVVTGISTSSTESPYVSFVKVKG